MNGGGGGGNGVAKTLVGYKTRLADVNVTISQPSSKPHGLTFLLPGSIISESEYDSTRDVLLEQNQVVISFFLNVLTTSHDRFALNIVKIFTEYNSNNNAKHANINNNNNTFRPFNTYSIVGHSVGAKVALLLAAKHDPTRVKTVIAVDPVDEVPTEFTNACSRSSNLSLECTQNNARVQITFASDTPGRPFGIGSAHNARAIHEANKEWIEPLVVHTGASHMAYTDNGGGLPGLLIRGGTREANEDARRQLHALIRRLIQ